MKRTSSHVIKETPESTELYLYAVNESTIYPAVIATVRSLAKKWKKGTYDAGRAVDAYFPIATEAARRYCKEFARIEDAPHVFNVTARFTAAAEMEAFYRENVEKNDL